MKRLLLFLMVLLTALLSINTVACAQQYKLHQATNMMGVRTESTIYVKGSRKRTESAGIMGMAPPPITVEQCDLQRTIKINDKKKLYFIEPFAKGGEDVIDDDEKPAAVKTKPVSPKEKITPQTGGTITMWYSITDTGERKKIYGFNARHVWTYQKIKPSPDACSMKDSIVMKSDGWYIDLPQFNCPIQYRPSKANVYQTEKQAECTDHYVTHRSGKGKLGFALTETRTIILNNKSAQTSEVSTNLETLEFSTAKLDSMLFEIPIGYTQTMNEADLQDKFDVKDMINQYKNMNKENGDQKTAGNEQKKPGITRIGVYQPKGDEQVQAPVLQQQLVSDLTEGSIEAIAVSSEEEAKKYFCDYTLATDFIKIKSASKVGGLLKVIKNSDPNAASSYNIEANLTLIKLSDGSTRLQPKVDGKFEGKINEAAKKALDDGSRQILKALK